MQEERPRAWLDLLVLSALGFLLYLPSLGLAPLDNEEGRRFLPAREMFESGDLVLPTLFGRPYLAKPPLHYWLIDLASLPAGEVTPWSTRLPSALAVIGLAWILYALGSKYLDRTTGRIAACVWLLLPMALDKGRLGELEAPLAFFVGASLACHLAAVEGRRWATLAGGVALALAVLTKGPAAWIFLGAGALGSAALEPRRARAHLVPALISAIVSALLAGVWVLLLAHRMGWEDLYATWTAELLGGEHTWRDVAQERVVFLQRTLTGFLPSSVLLLALAPRRARAGGLPALVRFALVVAAGASVFFLCYARLKARYVFPAGPWVALAGAYVIARGFKAARAEIAGRVVAFSLAGLAVVAPLLSLAFLADRYWLRIFSPELSGRGVALAVLAVALGFFALVALRRGSRGGALGATLASLVLLRVLHLTEIVPADPRAGVSRTWTAGMAAALPSEGRTFTTHWADFNLLAAVPRRLRFTSAPERDVGPGDVLLYAPDLGELQPGDIAGWAELGSFSLPRGHALVAVRRP